jgi:hypothetical protein
MEIRRPGKDANFSSWMIALNGCKGGHYRCEGRERKKPGVKNQMFISCLTAVGDSNKFE